MITADKARDLMPSNRRDTILDEVEEIIIDAASEDKTLVELPKGFFGEGVEEGVIFNAKHHPLYDYTKVELERNGFKLGRNVNKMCFVISWGFDS